VVGVIFVAAGLGLMAMMTVSPEGLEVPYWVGMAAASTFALAGASVIVQDLGHDLAGRLLALGAVLGLATPGLWILLDPAEKQCTASVGFFGGGATSGAGDLVCRAVFGFGGALALAIAVFGIVTFARHVRRRKPPHGGRDAD
jgi:hypothetical protein